MSAIVALVLKYLPALITASKSVPEIITFVSNLRAIFARTKVWSQAEEDAFDKSVEDLKSDPAWEVRD